MSEEVEEVGKFAIEIKRHLLHLRRIGSDLVTEDIVRRQTDRKKVSRRAAADVFVKHELFCEVQFVFVGECS